MLTNFLGEKTLNKFTALTLATLLSVTSFLVFSTNNVNADGNGVGTQDIEITIESGGLHLEIPDINNFGDITLGETDEAYTGFDEGKLLVKDLTGLHEGWHVTVSSTQFETSNGVKLSPGTLSLAPVSINDKPEGSEIGTPFDDRKVIDDGQRTVITADVGHGAGITDFEFGEDAFGLNIDSESAKVGEYTATVTWTIESGPSSD